MTPGNHSWPAVKQVVEDALELPPSARPAFLDEKCADPGFRAAVERLLRACERAAEPGSFLDAPAAEFAAPVVAEVDDAERTDPSALRIALAGRYTLEGELGRGGMATVYLARDERHGRRVAVKVVRAGIPAADTPSLGARRFQREIEIAARLTHPHILPLHDSGAASGLLYYVMPHVDGESLRDRLGRTGALSVGDAVAVLRDVASALAHAHRHGVVHRDIKPANILLNQDGDALVSDFGVATALAAASSASRNAGGDAMTDLVLGTPAYIAPEQAAGDPDTDHRADLYSLGVVAYELLTGVPPFAGRSTEELLAAHASQVPDPVASHRPDVPPALDTLITRLLAKRPADRPADAAEVLHALDATTAGSLAGAASAQLPARRRLVLTGGMLLLVITALVLALLARGEAAGERSIAVLPFVNTSGNADDEPFSDGLTDELIGALSRVPDLKVAGRTSAFALKGKALSVRTIADTLGVATVLEGTVRRDGERFKVSAQLVDARHNRVLWSDTYDRDARDIFSLQEEIARSIVGALAPRLTGNELPARLVERGTENLEAYQRYLRGRFLYNTRQRDGLLRARQYFEDAAALDPAYANAYAGLADVYNLLGILGYARPHDVFPKAKAAAERAIALDSMLVEGYAALAHALFVYEWNWEGAERAFQHALSINPSYSPVHIYYGVFQHITGRHEAALASMQRARELDPLIHSGIVIGRVYVNTNRPAEAIAYLQEVLELNANIDLAHQQLAHAYLQLGRHQEAIAAMQRAAELSGARDSAQLAYIYAMTGDTTTAQRIVRGLLDSAAQRYVPPFHMAMAYAGLGQTDEAFRWLEAAYEQRASFMDGLAVHTGFQSLRSDPRFAQLLKRMGLQ